LHSAISADQQRAAFKVPPAGTRKIVLSTNIAETSVTLEDVVVVIDGGRHKERRFDPHKRCVCAAMLSVTCVAFRLCG
jgi:ATP-dependent RNA helicase DHX29